jgi:hypothetical protein
MVEVLGELCAYFVLMYSVLIIVGHWVILLIDSKTQLEPTFSCPSHLFLICLIKY